MARPLISDRTDTRAPGSYGIMLAVKTVTFPVEQIRKSQETEQRFTIKIKDIAISKHLAPSRTDSLTRRITRSRFGMFLPATGAFDQYIGEIIENT